MQASAAHSASPSPPRSRAPVSSLSQRNSTNSRQRSSPARQHARALLAPLSLRELPSCSCPTGRLIQHPPKALPTPRSLAASARDARGGGGLALSSSEQQPSTRVRRVCASCTCTTGERGRKARTRSRSQRCLLCCSRRARGRGGERASWGVRQRGNAATARPSRPTRASTAS